MPLLKDLFVLFVARGADFAHPFILTANMRVNRILNLRSNNDLSRQNARSGQITLMTMKR